MAKAKKPIVKKEVIEKEEKSIDIIEVDASLIEPQKQTIEILEQENKGLKIELDHSKKESEYHKNANLENLEIIAELKSQIENLTTKKEVAKITSKTQKNTTLNNFATQMQGGLEKKRNKYGIEIIQKIK